MTRPAVIYLFTSPSGRAYAGRHTCDPEGWPRRGSGPLPSGYRGSGLLWANVTKKHGPAIRWVILRRFPAGTPRATVDEAERRAIRLVRAIWGERCMNVNEGGTGHTSEEAREKARLNWADPAWADRQRELTREAQERRWADPEHREQMSAMMSLKSQELWADPEYADRLRSHLDRINSDPELVAARNRQIAAVGADLSIRERARPALLRALRDPETRAKMSASRKASAKVAALRADEEFEARRKAAAASPEAKAKRLATMNRNRVRAMNAANKARRERAQQETQP